VAPGRDAADTEKGEEEAAPTKPEQREGDGQDDEILEKKSPGWVTAPQKAPVEKQEAKRTTTNRLAPEDDSLEG
jgi:hypothetical protein